MIRATIVTALALAASMAAGCGSTTPADPVETATVCTAGEATGTSQWGTTIRGDASGQTLTVYVPPDDATAQRFLDTFEDGGTDPKIGRVSVYVYRWDAPPTKTQTEFLTDCLDL